MKRLSLVFLTILVLVSSFSIAHAQYSALSQSEALLYESVVNLSSTISVNIDNSIDVEEAIDYNTGGIQRHGIYRDISPYSSDGSKMSLSQISVTDKDGAPYQYKIESSGKNVRIKIGDPNQTFIGQRFYDIKYHATHAVAHLKDVDEIYWNVTGDDWEIPIFNASAKVLLPEGASVTQSACYYGYKGSKDRCDVLGTNTTSFLTAGVLGPKQGMTVAVGFPKGIVLPYSGTDKVAEFLRAYQGWFLAALLPLLVLFFAVRYWYKKGRDPKGTGVIVPQYDAPDGLTPLEAAAIVYEKMTSKDISAEIIYLATRGYIRITELEEKILGIFKHKNYELTPLRDVGDLKESDQMLMLSLFSITPEKTDAFSLFGMSKSLIGKTTAEQMKSFLTGPLQPTKLSDLKNVFFRRIPVITDSTADSLLFNGYYKNLGSLKNARSAVSSAFISVGLGIFFGAFITNFTGINPILAISSVTSSIIIWQFIYKYSPAKTEKGVASKEYLLGLKMYLTIAEKDRLEFHNAPEKKPEIFEKLLPYAMVLGAADIWAKEFEGIYNIPPSWYVGTPGSTFNVVAFNHSISSFSLAASSSLSSAPGGSGGGGSSGGGGGGGGGGGW